MNAERNGANNGEGQGGHSSDPATRPRVRCAIYTRKSTDENVDTDFNSLDAQRESGESYIKSQAQEGWVALPERYDDIAFSGATTERPALQRLLADVEAGGIDTVVVYKIDRFSRSLLDFTKLIERLEQHDVSLVAVTQQFNTTTSMGMLTLNILLSFAQFEREVIAERIRDKMAAAKRRGKYVGGVPPLGYDVDREKKRLVVNPEEATLVRFIFGRFLQLRSALALVRELNEKGHTTKAWTTKKGVKRPGRPWNTGNIYKLLDNPIYVGRVRHKDKTYPGEHKAIIERSLWDEARAARSDGSVLRNDKARTRIPALLRGIIRCGHCNANMTTTYTRKRDRTYRYYLCGHAAKNGRDACPLRRVPAGDVEETVLLQLRALFRDPMLLVTLMPAAVAGAMSERIAAGFATLDRVWDHLVPAEKERIARLLVKDVTVSHDGIDLALRIDGLDAVMTELAHRESEDASEVSHA